MGGQTGDKSNLQVAYERAGMSYEAITEFRAKLLALLPLATGIGTFFLLERAQKETDGGSEFKRFLGPIGLFSVVVTLGLFAYEFRGMQRCHRLEMQAAVLESDLGLSTEQGPFLGQPPRALGNMLGPPAAGLIIYLATVFAWLWLAGYGFYGFKWWGWSYAWGFLIGYGIVLMVVWIWVWWGLKRAATGGLSPDWKRYIVEMPPMSPTWTSEVATARWKVKKAARKPELTAELDQAENEYLETLNRALLKSRIRAAARHPQRGERRRNARLTLTGFRSCLRSSHWLQNLLRIGLAVVLPLGAGYLLIGIAAYAGNTGQTKEDLSESVAALIAAVIGVTGTHLGHKAGRRRRASDAMSEPHVSQEMALRVTGREALLFLVVVAILGALAWAAVKWFHLDWAAVAALTASVVGVTGVHVLHDLRPRPLSSTPSRVIGAGIAFLFVVVGFILILRFQERAEGWAALAAAAVGLGGTHIGHAAGYQDESVPTLTTAAPGKR